MDFLERTELLLSKSKIDAIKNSNIIIFGVGGVGGYVADMLVRMGVENLTIVDFDIYSVSNKNRQIMALNSTIGKLKVEVLKERFLDINPNCSIQAISKKLLPENIQEFNLKSFNYIIDCIDMVTSKIALINYCFQNQINIISSAGTGNRIGIPKFDVKDIYSTKNDGLSKVLRHELKKLGVKKLDIVQSEQDAVKQAKIGSVAYYPNACACVIVGYIIEQITKSY